jgi:plastocyanin
LINYYQFLITDHRPPITDHRSPITDHRSGGEKMTRHFRVLAALMIVSAMATAAVLGNSTAAAGRVSGSISIINAKNKNLSNVVVWLEPSSKRAQKSQAKPQQLLMRQKGKQLLPHVLVATVGQQVDFPNEDPFPHNVFSSSEVKRFDLGIYQQGESRSVLLSRPGVITVHCNVHPQMEAFIVVVNTTYFGLSNKRGEIQINDVPPGNYRLKVWHERATAEKLNDLSRPLAVTASGANFGNIQIDEGGFSEKTHKNKEGKDYD